MSDHNDLYDEVLSRTLVAGPEFEGWLSNHAPMAADALIRTGSGDAVHRWLDRYLGRVEERPAARFPIAAAGWRDPLGDASRLGDWLDLFEHELDAAPWTDVLTTWWPRLITGAVASATHPLIRTGHAVRALREAETPERIAELAQALGYWAARWSPLPATASQPGALSPRQALDGVPAIGRRGGARARLAALAENPDWPYAGAAVSEPQSADDVPAAIDALVDAAVERYPRWAPAQPAMLVHMATAPRAASLVLPVLPRDLWVTTYRQVWRTSAAIAAIYRPAEDVPPVEDAGFLAATLSEEPGEIAASAAATGDEHAIKFTEVALESHVRGEGAALGAARTAVVLLRGE